MIKKTFYFGHDYNARSDEKIIKLISKEGWEGYGIYWAIIEKLYEAGGYLDEDYTCIAFDLRTDCDRIATVIKDYNLFEVANKKISSKSVLARLRHTFGISEKNRQNAKKRWDKQEKEVATALRPHTSGNAIKEKKVKEKKVKEILKDGTIKILKDNTKVIKRFGKWVDYNNTNIQINLSYYPELNNL